ncbi:hypothetical protein C8J55DRAFT_39911 [Lentinula edodes]|uniref:Uncharacterized protein n=1 Tax=Lentinula lateritia TaxID=40482 RepID=A0A9W9DT06_9AGAR|nr:hypothetical protein C8J55DRAFT_39911 [Lentinula edodes]
MSKVTPPNAGENVYKKREQDSIPAPLDCSSDSEFAAGPVKPMEKGSGKRRNTKLKRESIRPAKKRKVVWSDSEDEEWMASFDSSVNSTNKSQIYGKHTIKNPLAKYFVEIDHGSEDDADDEMQIEDDIDIDEDREYGEDEDPAYIPKTMAAFLPVINTRRTNTPPELQSKMSNRHPTLRTIHHILNQTRNLRFHQLRRLKKRIRLTPRTIPTSSLNRKEIIVRRTGMNLTKKWIHP